MFTAAPMTPASTATKTKTKSPTPRPMAPQANLVEKVWRSVRLKSSGGCFLHTNLVIEEEEARRVLGALREARTREFLRHVLTNRAADPDSSAAVEQAMPEAVFRYS